MIQPACHNPLLVAGGWWPLTVPGARLPETRNQQPETASSRRLTVEIVSSGCGISPRKKTMRPNCMELERIAGEHFD
jgi:hypothetical protein